MGRNIPTGKANGTGSSRQERPESPPRGNHRIRSRADAAVERRQDISAQSQSLSPLEPNLLRRGQQLCGGRNGYVFPEWGRLLDAHQEGPGAAGFEIFQASAAAEVMAGRPQPYITLAAACSTCRAQSKES